MRRMQHRQPHTQPQMRSLDLSLASVGRMEQLRRGHNQMCTRQERNPKRGLSALRCEEADASLLHDYLHVRSLGRRWQVLLVR